MQLECPQCHHNNNKYYYNQEKGVGYCFHCSYSGRNTSLNTPSSDDHTRPSPVLNQAYVEAAQSALLASRPALSYLMNDRGLKLQTIKHFQLGYEPEIWLPGKGGGQYCVQDAIVIPHLDMDNKVVGIKYRFIDKDKDPKCITPLGSKMQLYNGRVLLSTQFPWCIIAEGEIDCMTLFQVASQLPATAVPGMTTFKERWLKWFDRFEKIYIAFDREDAADERAEELAKKLKDYRCYRLRVPEGVKDINEMYNKLPHDKALTVWRQLMREAPCIGQPLIKETKEYTQEIKDHYFGSGGESISTGFDALDTAMGGLLPGRVYLLKGNTGLGKTSFALHMLLNVAEGKRGKVLIGSFEMKVAEEMMLKVLSKLLGWDLNSRGDKLSPAQIEKLIEGVGSFIPISWINRHDKLRLGELYDAVKIKYTDGFRFLLLDHAQFMMNLGKEDAVYSETAKVSKFIKRLTNDFPELTILLITELNSQEGTFGGKSLEYDSDVVLSYYGTGLEVQKHRVDSRHKGRKVQIRWDQEKCRYTVF